MATDTDIQQARSLLGLRPPAGLADGALAGRAQLAPAQGPSEMPARPTYPVVSSGWDSEDEEPRGKSSDLLTALKAAAVILSVTVVLALLLR
jgi:hypothetical protein